MGPHGRQHPRGEVGVGHTDELAAHLAGVGHRSEQVEDGRDPDLTAGRRGETERRMEPRREAEPEAGLLDAAADGGRAELDRHAERFEHVGGAAQRGRPARAVLAHGHAGAGRDERGHRRHVDRVRAIATGTDDVDRPLPQVVAERDEVGVGEHGVEHPRELLGRLPLGAQRDDEPDQLRGGRVTGQDRVHRRPGLLGRQVTPFEQLGEQAGPPAVVGEGELGGGRVGCFGTARRHPGESRRSRGPTALADDPPSLTLGGAPPDAGFLARAECVLEAGDPDPTTGADRLGRLGVVVLVRVEDAGVETATGPQLPPFDVLERH